MNAFCLRVFIGNRKLHKLEYCLVVMQTVFDLLFTGILGLTDYLLDVWSALIYFCTYSGFNFNWDSVKEWSRAKPSQQTSFGILECLTKCNLISDVLEHRYIGSYIIGYTF